MDFSKRHIWTELKLSFGATLPYTLDNLVCIALHVFLLQRMLPLSSLVAFLFFLSLFFFLLPISFYLMLKLNDNLFCNDNLVIFAIFFLQFPPLLLWSLFSLVCKFVIKCWIIIIKNEHYALRTVTTIRLTRNTLYATTASHCNHNVQSQKWPGASLNCGFMS